MAAQRLGLSQIHLRFLPTDSSFAHFLFSLVTFPAPTNTPYTIIHFEYSFTLSSEIIKEETFKLQPRDTY